MNTSDSCVPSRDFPSAHSQVRLQAIAEEYGVGNCCPAQFEKLRGQAPEFIL